MIRTLLPNRLLSLTCSCVLMVCSANVWAQTTKSEERLSVETQQEESLKELAALKESISLVKERQSKLEDEVRALDKDRASINKALINAAKRAQELETQISEEEKRLASMEVARNGLRKVLASKRGLLSEILAALQRMGRNPPPAILVTPEDALTSVRSAILLGAVVPEVRRETNTLLSELKALTEISRQISERKAMLSETLNKLAEDETRLTLLIDEKSSLARKSRDLLKSERQKAEELAAKANSLEELIGEIEKKIESAALAAEKARKLDEKRQSEEAARLKKAREDIAKGLSTTKLRDSVVVANLDQRFQDTSREEPALPFAATKGILPLPVSGDFYHRFGAPKPAGGVHHNIAIVSRPNTRVISPADGWIVYAGRFRSYGQLVIINVGSDHHIVLSGMANVNVSAGQFVLTGEPIAQMGSVRIASAGSVDLSSGNPLLYVEFRKGKDSIDPSPWWAAKD